MVVAEDLPSQMPSQEIRKLGTCLGHFVAMNLVQTGCTNSHHGNQKKIWGLVWRERWLVHCLVVSVFQGDEKGASLTDWDLFTEMEPVTPDVSLHHLPTQHMTIVTTVTL